MTNEDPNAPVAAGPARRAPRQGVGGSPVGSTLSIVLAVVAVVVGFLILRNITDDGGSAGSIGGGASTESTVTPPSSTEPPPPSSTEPALVTDGATVVVANASGVGGSAGAMTDELAAAGFTMATPTNATSSGQADSVVYYDPAVTGALPVAESVATVMGGLAVSEVPSPIPVDGASLNGAGVLVMLGRNESNKTLAELSGGDDEDATATLITPPEPSDGTVDTTGTTEAP